MYRRYLLTKYIGTAFKIIACAVIAAFFIFMCTDGKNKAGLPVIIILFGLLIFSFICINIRNTDFSDMKATLNAMYPKDVDEILAGMTKIDSKTFISDSFFCSLSDRIAIKISDVSDFLMDKEQRVGRNKDASSYTIYFLQFKEYNGKCYKFYSSNPQKVIKAYEILKQAKGDFS